MSKRSRYDKVDQDCWAHSDILSAPTLPNAKRYAKSSPRGALLYCGFHGMQIATKWDSKTCSVSLECGCVRGKAV